MLNMSWRNSEQTIANFKARGPQIIAALSGKINLLMFELASFVQREKLSGQMLVPRTGKLRASVHALETTIVGTSIRGTVAAAEGVAFYGQISEKGVPSMYEIAASKARFLKFIADGRERFAKSVTHPAMSPKPFMALSEQESAAHIYEELEKSVSDVTKE